MRGAAAIPIGAGSLSTSLAGTASSGSSKKLNLGTVDACPIFTGNPMPPSSTGFTSSRAASQRSMSSNTTCDLNCVNACREAREFAMSRTVSVIYLNRFFMAAQGDG